MSDDDGTYQGEGPSLQAAFEDAWHKAKKDHPQGGRFKANVVGVEASNPIHAYIVTIGPPDGG